MIRAFRALDFSGSLLNPGLHLAATPRTATRAPGTLFLALVVVSALVVPTLAPALQHPVEPVRLSPELLTVEQVGDATPSLDVVVRYRGATSRPAGAPDLPKLPVWVEVPAGMRVVGVTAEAVGMEELGRAWVRPVAPDAQPGEAMPAAVQDPAIYEGGTYPAAWARIATRGSLRGHQVACVEVAPVRWEPASGRLHRASLVRLELELEPATAGGPEMLVRRRVVPEIEARFEQSVERMIRGFEPAAARGSLAGNQIGKAGDGPAGPGPFQPTFRPSTDGSAVEYVIVTSEELTTEFQRLADWKTRKGVQAVVRTVEWIDETYPNGVDRAERIRFFIRDAYQNWGTLFVLLGGDTEIVPARYGETTFHFDNGESIPADMYYGCLDGNWNGDGDARFGEGESQHGPSDEADLLFEIVEGRAPVTTIAEAANFVDKTLLYDADPPSVSGYPASVVVLAERLFDTIHGADVAEEALTFVPGWMNIERIYEESQSYPGSTELDLDSAIQGINDGYGIVHHVGHGYRNTMSVGGGTLNNIDVDNFDNAPSNSVVFAINCSSVSIDFNSIGEHWIKNPSGGSIAYIGTSRVAFLLASTAYQNGWYETVFDDSVTTIGMATDMTRAVLVPDANNDSSARWNLMATNLLGDPELDIYTNAVVPMQVSHPATVEVGSGPMTVTARAQGAPVAGATVTIWRDGEVYVRATTAANGSAELPITADSPGPLELTVHKSYYRPYSSTLTVGAGTAAYCFVQNVELDDDQTGMSSGDGDGLADAGETIELRLTIKNGGGASASGVIGLITADDPENALTIDTGSVSFGTLAPGGSSSGGQSFVITIGPVPDAYQPVLTVTILSGQGTWEEQIVLPIRHPYLEHYSHDADDNAPRGNGNGIVEAGETIYYRVTLRNAGQDGATAVTGALRALDASNLQPHPDVTVSDATATFGNLAPQGQVEGDRFTFTLDPGTDPSTLLLELTLSDALGEADLQFLDVQSPAPADSFTAFGAPTSIRLNWKPAAAPDVKGYDIFRSNNPGGPFTRVNDYTVDGSSVYEDVNLEPLTRYYYQVVTRDTSYNASDASDVATASTNPAFSSGWPQEIAHETSSSIIVADIDGGSQIEVLVGGEMQYAWHGDGTEVVDGDNDPRTSGPFSLQGWNELAAGFSGTPAAGDLTLSGELQIANVTFARDSLFVWNNQGQLMPGWPKRVLGDFNWASTLLADLDLDGDLEVVLWAGHGYRLFAWHHNGIELVDGDNNPGTNGVLVQLPGGSNTFNYSSPAVAQLDQDPQLEILFAINFSPDDSGAVHAYNIDGSPVPGWPFLTGNAQQRSQVTASLAVADLDHNGTDEVVVACERQGGTIYVLNRNGTIAPGWPRNAPCYTTTGRTSSPSIGDVTGDGFLDIVLPDTSGRLWVWNRFGVQQPGFPVTYFPNPVSQTTESTASIGDIDGDGAMEIVFGDEQKQIHAYNHDGTLVDGFPIQVGGEVRGTPALWDIDRDGLIEVAVLGFDTHVYVWDMPGDFNPTLLPWPFFRHDIGNTGRFSTPVQPIGIGDPGPSPTVPVAAALHPARPNPFNPSVTLTYDVPGDSNATQPVTLGIYDVNGRLVRRLIEGAVGAGRHVVSWDGRNDDGARMASGIYFTRITIGDFSATQKLTMLR